MRFKANRAAKVMEHQCGPNHFDYFGVAMNCVNFSIAIRFGGKAAYIDESDLPVFTRREWFINNGYLKAKPGGDELLHRVLMCPPSGMVVDHKNGDRSDNRRCNLRVCTHSENMRNSKTPKSNTSGIKGVYIESRKNRSLRYIAQIKYEGRKINLGRHLTLEGAALAYANAAIKYHGEFARIK